MSDTLIIIPTYNEIDNIEEILRVVFGLEKVYHVLIVDDGSPDGTAEEVKRYQKQFPERLHLLERSGKQSWTRTSSGQTGVSSPQSVVQEDKKHSACQ